MTSFYEVYNSYKDFDFDTFLSGVDKESVERNISSSKLTHLQFLTLLSNQAVTSLEVMAQRSHYLTNQFFGKTISLYTPMYLSDFCDNKCPYCGFNFNNKIKRKKLTLAEVEEEAKFLSETGLQHILILTGESRKMSSVSYLKMCIRILKKYFSSISVEIYSLEELEYKELVLEGIDGLTIYQEVYNQEKYEALHRGGPKRDYLFRLDAPERALRSRMRTVSVGALLGLDSWIKEVFFLGLHAKYLQDKYSDSEISVSIPRIQPQVASFKADCEITDTQLVQIITALRIFLPRVGINLSTRESENFRDNIMPLGVTKMSAGSTTVVGGHTLNADDDLEQFSISDKRDVLEIKRMLLSKGYQPVLKDWMLI